MTGFEGDAAEAGTFHQDSSLSAVVLAAGEGKRMQSTIPKPLQPVAGKPMVAHVLAALVGLGLSECVVVVGRSAALVREVLEDPELGLPKLVYAVQEQPRGTGDAAVVGLDALSDGDADVVVVPADAPMLTTATLRRLVEVHRSAAAAATLLVTELEDPTGYGRVLRSPAGAVLGLIEEADATPEQRSLRQVCTSVYCFSIGPVRNALARLRPENAQGEYYLTDVVGLLVNDQELVEAVLAPANEVIGVNDRDQLALVDRLARGQSLDPSLLSDKS